MKKLYLFFVFAFSLFFCESKIFSQNIAVNTSGAAAAATNMFEVTQTSTAANMVALYAIHSGAAAGTGYGFQALKTGASTTNIAGYFSATGATNNYAIIVPSGGGRVGIGTSAPQRILDLSNAGQLTFGNDVVTSSTNGIYWHSGSGYSMARTTGAWTAPNYQQLAIQFATGITIDGGSLYGLSGTVLQPGAGNVGIGIAAPLEKLHVVGNTRISTLAGTGARMIQADANGTLVPLAAGTASQVLLGTGTWGGIPAGSGNYIQNQTTLQATSNYNISGSGNVQTSYQLQGTNAIFGNANDIYGNIRVIQNNSSTLLDGMYINYNSTGGAAAHLKFYANGTTERMRIDASNGYVGIGTTGPSEILHVRKDQNAKTRFRLSNLTAGTSATSELYIERADANILSVGIGDPTYANTAYPVDFRGAYLWTGATQGITLRTDGAASPIRFTTLVGAVPTEAMRIAAGGNVGIGATAPNEQLEITRNFRFPATTGSTAGVIMQGADRFIHTFGSADNIFIGIQAGNFTTSGTGNTTVGLQTLLANSTGYYNTAIGAGSMYSNTTGNTNTAVGVTSLYTNTTGIVNTAIGRSALAYNSNGYYNTAVGAYALYRNTSGYSNVAMGRVAHYWNTTGYSNVAIGDGAYYGASPGIAYFNSMALGASSAITASNQVRVGNGSVTSIGGIPGWSTLSDERFKKDIKENVPGLAFITKLRPVTYYLDIERMDDFLQKPDSLRLYRNSQFKAKALLQTGFLAQEVEKIANALGFDFSGVDKPKNENDYYGLRYAEFTVPLVKSVQELNAQNEAQQKTIELLLKRIEALENPRSPK